MSIVGEVLNEFHSNDLLRILKVAIDSGDPKIILFNKNYIYPLWVSYSKDFFRQFTDDEKYVIWFYERVDKEI